MRTTDDLDLLSWTSLLKVARGGGSDGSGHHADDQATALRRLEEEVASMDAARLRPLADSLVRDCLAPAFAGGGASASLAVVRAAGAVLGLEAPCALYDALMDPLVAVWADTRSSHRAAASRTLHELSVCAHRSRHHLLPHVLPRAATAPSALACGADGAGRRLTALHLMEEGVNFCVHTLLCCEPPPPPAEAAVPLLALLRAAALDAQPRVQFAGVEGYAVLRALYGAGFVAAELARFDGSLGRPDIADLLRERFREPASTLPVAGRHGRLMLPALTGATTTAAAASLLTGEKTSLWLPPTPTTAPATGRTASSSDGALPSGCGGGESSNGPVVHGRRGRGVPGIAVDGSSSSSSGGGGGGSGDGGGDGGGPPLPPSRRAVAAAAHGVVVLRGAGAGRRSGGSTDSGGSATQLYSAHGGSRWSGLSGGTQETGGAGSSRTSTVGYHALSSAGSHSCFDASSGGGGGGGAGCARTTAGSSGSSDDD
eukprot:Rhum_TRINITY_DN9773_c0_g1::Rhum_TRINITY_DN9773_c0_g1_i1::g.35124::m.35124